MILVFSRSHKIGSAIIRTICWGPWSHVGIATPDKTVLEAAWPHGVREVGGMEFCGRASHWLTARVQVPDEGAGIRWAREQIGRPYDWTGVLGLGLHRDWQDDSSWWCSEFVEAAIVAAGRVRFREARRITPTDQWRLADEPIR